MCSLADWQQLNPIIVDSEYRLLAGATRIQAVALAIGLVNIGPDAIMECVKSAGKASTDDPGAVSDKAQYLWTKAESCPKELKFETRSLDDAFAANALSVEENLRHEQINPVDLGYFFAEACDRGQLLADLARRYYPGIPIDKAIGRIEEYIRLTHAKDTIQEEVRVGSRSVVSALNSVNADSNGEAGGSQSDKAQEEPVFIFSPKRVYNALNLYRDFTTGEKRGSLDGFKGLFNDAEWDGEALVKQHGDALYNVLINFCCKKKDKPKVKSPAKAKKDKNQSSDASEAPNDPVLAEVAASTAPAEVVPSPE